uniref:Uncharacterized protein n=1 Tax=Anguilla anguilla TaxID=7936 RepID=A0A0E9VAQ0_ANGAN
MKLKLFLAVYEAISFLQNTLPPFFVVVQHMSP